MKKYTLSYLKLLNSPNCQNICMISKDKQIVLESSINSEFVIKNFLNLYFPTTSAVYINYIKKFKFGNLTIN